VNEAVDTESAGAPPGLGASAYRRALAQAGGIEVKALTHSPDGSMVCASIYDSPPYSLVVPPLEVPRLAVNLTAARVSGGIHGDRPRSYAAGRHSMFLTPAGEPVTWQKEAPSRHLGIYFKPDLFNDTDEAEPFIPSSMTLFNVNVPGVAQLIDQFTDELQAPGLLSSEAAESLARLVLIRLARHIHRGAAPAKTLTPKVIDRLRDYIMQHLEQRILVADLAKLAGLSPNHFAASFMEQTGQSPHQFVLAQRVDRAAELLARSDLSLTLVAIDCGFSSQQHMSNAVRRFLGVTPGRYRALRKGSRVTRPSIPGRPR
jgi:AraC family transcriptional regulator